VAPAAGEVGVDDRVDEGRSDAFVGIAEVVGVVVGVPAAVEADPGRVSGGVGELLGESGGGAWKISCAGRCIGAGSAPAAAAAATPVTAVTAEATATINLVPIRGPTRRRDAAGMGVHPRLRWYSARAARSRARSGAGSAAFAAAISCAKGRASWVASASSASKSRRSLRLGRFSMTSDSATASANMSQELLRRRS
jgi:hypothetical protein